MTKTPTLKQLLVKNTGVQLVAHGISLGIGLLTTVVLSRYLKVEGFAEFNYIFAFFYFFLSINDFGANVIVVREISQARDRAGEILGAMLPFKLLLAAISVLAAWGAIWLMEFPSVLANALFLYSLILPVIALQLPAVIFQVVLKLEVPVIIGICNRVFGFLLLMIFVWMGYGLKMLVLALILAEVSFLLLLWKYWQVWVQPVWRLDLGLWKKILGSSIPVGITGLFVALINRVDFIMLERMTDLHQVGLYSAAYKVTNLLEAFPLMVMGTLYPLMSRYAGEDLDKLRALYRKSSLFLTAIGIAVGCGVSVFSPLIVRLIFGAPFAEADQSLVVLVWSTVCLYAALSGGNLLISMRREKINLVLNILAAGLNVGLNFLLIPSLGHAGAAVSTTAAYLFILIGISIACHTVLRSAASASSSQAAGAHVPVSATGCREGVAW